MRSRRAASFLRFLSALGLAAGLALAAHSPARAADEQQPPELGEKVSETFSRIQPLWDAKNWDGVLAELDALVPTLDPNGYDMAVVQFNRAKMLLQKDKLGEAVAPLSTALRLADEHPNFVGNGPPLGRDEVNQMVYLLAQIYAQSAGETKNPAEQRAGYDKALDYLRRYMKSVAKPSQDAQYSYAQLILSEAVSDPKNVNKAELHEAEKEIHKGLLMSAKPPENFYVLLVYALQQDEDLKDAAKYSELLVKQYPKKKDYWNNLWAMYTNLAGMEKDDATAHTYYARAINTFERAQPLGFLNTPKDNYNLITLYYNAGQYRRATELLDAGLHNGTIDANDLKNWQLLAYSYQQINDYGAAIHAYEMAEEHFSDNASLDVDIAQIHTQLDNTEAAYHDYERAVKKSNLEHGLEVYRALAFDAFTLGEDKNDPSYYDKALKAMEEGAQKYPKEAASDKNWKQLHDFIQETIKHNAALKASVEAQQKQ